MKTPAELHLPWPDWRPGQRLAIRTALTTKKPHTIIQAPTGSGKTAIAGAIAAQRGTRVGILTATNGLMQQYERLLPWLTPIRGAGNYECLAARDELKKYFRMIKHRSNIMCDDGPCRSGIKCSLKESGCEYFDAYRTALNDRTPISNYAYFLAINRYGNGLGTFSDIVCDEAHALAEELMKAHQQRIDRSLLQGKEPKTRKQWVRWANAELARLPSEGAERDDDRVKVKRLRDTLVVIAGMDRSWAWDWDQDHVVFEPTIPRQLLSMLAGKDTRVIHLSATIAPASLQILGIDPADIEHHEMPSRFDVKNRPVYVLKCVRVDYKWNQSEHDWWLRTIDQIVKGRTDRNGLIHTVSYERADDIIANSKYRDLMITRNFWGRPCAPRAKDLAGALDELRTSRTPKILVHPAIGTGYDFAHDMARYQIVAKLPFPNTTSSIMRARITHTEGYRDNLTMRTLVQTVGRPVREDTDWAETFIIDDHARWFLTQDQYRDLAPDSFLEAVQWIKRVPDPPSL